MIQTIRRYRKLPAQGDILVSVGERVQPGTAVGKLDYIPGQLFRFNAADAFGIAPEHVPEALLEQPGDWVEAGEPLIATDEFFIERTVASPRTGYIGLISRVLGNVFIREPLPAGPKEPVVVSAADIGMSLIRFNANLGVMVGETVEKGRLLVSGGIGAKQSLLSPVFGKVTAFSRSEGTITIKPLFQPTEVLAHVAGTVTAVEPGDSVEITVTGHLIQGMIGYGGERVGELHAANAERDLEPADLPDDVQGKVIVGRCGASLAALKRCADGGADGLVLGSADYDVLKEFIAADPLQVTGPSADIPLTIILINGFGNLPMAADTYAELAGLSGRNASIDGSTQLRAGVVRPEVIVPLDGDGVASGTPAAPTVLAAGMRVMIIREPGFGVTGRIKSLTSQPQAVRSGALATTAVVVAEGDGRELTVPQSNLKVLEGVSA
ncbi:MAG: hypothetical protein ACM3XN_11170 [Chloroflexota bacterium]